MTPASALAPWLSTGSLAVLGTGAALPGPPIATADLIDRFAASFAPLPRSAATIARRLGVATRHHSRIWERRGEGPAPGASNPDLAAAAVTAALADAGLAASDLGFVIGHTATPAQPLPSNIAIVADRLGYAGPFLELRQACTGFASALVVAFGLLARADARPVAIVGSEVGSVFLDPHRVAAAAGPGRVAADPGQLVNLLQMGDGAGAIILGPAASGGSRLHAAWSGATGLGRAPGLTMRAGGSDAPVGGDGPLDFAHDFASIRATGARLFDAGLAAAAAHGIDPAGVETIIPHQVGGRIGDQLAAHTGLPPERFLVHADRVGNTGSAAIWLALAELRACGPAAGSRALVLGAEATKHMHGGFVYVH